MEIWTDPKKYIGLEFDCDCGKRHSSATREIAIGSGAAGELPAIVLRGGFKRPLVVSDENTEEALGESVKALLLAAGIAFGEYIFPDEKLHADADAIGRLLLAADDEYDLMLGVGSGTINDLCKYVGARTGRPSIIAATSASMDGFNTSVSILLINRLKTTINSQTPYAVVGETEVIRHSPMEMLAAGVGDMLGKYVSLLDWRIASIITGDYFCEYSAGIVEAAARAVVDKADGLAARGADVVDAVMSGLTLAGFPMGYNGSSQPGSGAEHQLAHFFDVRFTELGMPPMLHGTAVGISSVMATRLFELLRGEEVDFDRARELAKSYDAAAWEADIVRAYGGAAGAVIEMERKAGKNAPDAVLARIDRLEQSWPKIMELAAGLPTSARQEEILRGMDAPSSPVQRGVDRQMFLDCIYYAKDMRVRYGLLQMLFDLGLQKKLGEALAEEIYD